MVQAPIAEWARPVEVGDFVWEQRGDFGTVTAIEEGIATVHMTHELWENWPLRYEGVHAKPHDVRVAVQLLRPFPGD